jgi:hypothetical protein
MIQEFVDVVIANRDALVAEFQTEDGKPSHYGDLVKRLVTLLGKSREYGGPDPERITVIDHGDYQGTQLYIIGCEGYQPHVYWSIFVSYGSCSGCDSFEANRSYYYDDDDNSPEAAARRLKEAEGNYTMLLHMVQSMKSLSAWE